MSDQPEIFNFPIQPNTNPEPLTKVEGVKWFLIQASYEGSRPGWLQFYQGMEWPSGTGNVTTNRAEATPFYWVPGYPEYLCGGNGYLSWNDGPEFNPQGGIAQLRVWASAVRWAFVGEHLVPLGYTNPDRTLTLYKPGNIVTVRPDHQSLIVKAEYLEGAVV
jgi:hypothetical protein